MAGGIAVAQLAGSLISTPPCKSPKEAPKDFSDTVKVIEIPGMIVKTFHLTTSVDPIEDEKGEAVLGERLGFCIHVMEKRLELLGKLKI